jgi:hypothetical protein
LNGNAISRKPLSKRRKPRHYSRCDRCIRPERSRLREKLTQIGHTRRMSRRRAELNPYWR